MMSNQKKGGHRQRLRENFIAENQEALSDERILELLLTYGIPQKDVQPLAAELIAAYGSLEAVTLGDYGQLIQHKGLKEYSATLIKLVGWIRTKCPASEWESDEGATGTYRLRPDDDSPNDTDIDTKDISNDIDANNVKRDNSGTPAIKDEPNGLETILPSKRRIVTGLFGKAMLEEAIKMLPVLPNTESLTEVRTFLKENLPFNSEQTRSRNTSYIIQRMFPNGVADKALRNFARFYAGRQELRDVCYYRFGVEESIMLEITQDLFIPGMARGSLKRNSLKEYLVQKYPQSRSITDYVQAIVKALTAGGIAKCTRDAIFYSYRDINPASLAFILHSEFPEPGIYDIRKLEDKDAIKLMLWRPEQILPALFELRNQGLLAKVSEIDNVRQFTTKYTLEQLVAILTEGEI